MVLATDMKQHFALCSQFSTVHRLSAFSAERAKAAAPGAGSGGRPAEDAAVTSAAGLHKFCSHLTLKPTSQGLEVQEVVLSGTLPSVAVERCVSLSFTSAKRRKSPEAAPMPVDESERLLALCMVIKAADLGHLGESLELGFYEFVGLPLVHALSSAFPGAAPLMACFTFNYHHWLRVQQEAQAQQESRLCSHGGLAEEARSVLR
ncbi:hypothetical protein HYH02_007878 [Chlamydomonas schloesseri]|uniref:PDEase domain-containing protein n=1 Tax=Chlamydomonas schloesseri TaxID=2026947 RepID=A0A835WGL2_9CHLO|nr:hypothetical protein HYH02_007878 [Chlamydomonas schloesseri]|eukprot:KAG2447132.1 hypothetical protein HYH02_007878 [Chlamydomonas schloesseri]